MTLKAAVEGTGPENNAYALVDLLPGDAIRVTGFRRERDHRWGGPVKESVGPT